MTKKFEEKVVVVTGAASGIGAATSLELLRQGAKVVLADRDEEKLLAKLQELKDETGGEAVAVVADVSKEEGNRKIVETAMSAFGALHLSFINAGILVWATLPEVNDDAIDATFGSNFKGVVYGLKHQLPAISKSWDKGAVVITSSVAATRVYNETPEISLYCCSKAAAETMVKYGAIEGAKMNVRVNGVAPGVVMTPMAMTLGEEGVRCAWANDHLGGKPIYPADVATLVLLLLSEDAHTMNGSIYRCDAGCSLT